MITPEQPPATPQPGEVEAVARALFGPANAHWDKRWADLHENGSRLRYMHGMELGEFIHGKDAYRADAQAAIAAYIASQQKRIRESVDWHVVSEAVDEAVQNGEGRASAGQLEHAFMKHDICVYHYPDEPTDSMFREKATRPTGPGLVALPETMPGGQR